MRSSHRTVQIAFVITILTFIVPGISNGKPYRIVIDSKHRSLKVGDPLILKLVYKYETPLVNPTTSEVVESFLHHAYLRIEHREAVYSTNRLPVFPSSLTLEDKNGLEYSKWFVFLYHPGERRLLFPVPGTYKVTVSGYALISNPIDVIVEASSELQKKALSLLSDPNDYTYLEYHFHEYKEKRPERILHLKKVVEQCEGTVLANWCAARLGLEYFRQFHAKHPSFVKFQEQYEKGGANEPLFQQAYKCLTMGSKLADEFPIREEVLKNLVTVEFTKGNAERAISILDELGAKYPKGKYGRKAAKWKQELLDIQARKDK